MILLPALTVIVCKLFALGVVQSVVTVTFVTLLLAARRIALNVYRS